MTTEQEPQRNIYDDHPDGIGEIPAYGTPIEVSLRADRVNEPADLKVQAGRFGKLRSAIEAHTEREKAVGLQFAGPRSIKMYISEHPDFIKRTAAVVGVTGAAIATGVVVYMHEQRKRNK